MPKRRDAGGSIDRRTVIGGMAAGAAALTLPRAALAQAGLEARIPAIVQATQAALAEHNVAGAALGIVQGGRVLLLQGFGLRDIARQLPVTPDTLFPIASVTKSFAGMLAAIAVDEGRFTWQHHPRHFLPYFKLKNPEADRAANIVHLLSHTGGLRRDDLTWAMGTVPPQDVTRIAGEMEPIGTIGRDWNYTNELFAAGGDMTAAVYGMSWQDLVRQRILLPLGMARTRATQQGFEDAPEFAKGYQYYTAQRRHSRLRGVPFDVVAPAGSIYSTARDMVRWVACLADGGAFGGRRLVSEAGFAAMTRPYAMLQPGLGYGLGLFIATAGGVRFIEHGGNDWGYTTQLVAVPSHRAGMILLTNALASRAGFAVMQAFIDAVAQGRPGGQALPPAMALPPEERDGQIEADILIHTSALADLLGSYRSGLDGAVLRVEGNAIVLEIDREPPRRLSVEGDNRLRIEGVQGQHIEPVRGPRGAITGFRIVGPGGPREFGKVMGDIQGDLDGHEVMRRSVEAQGGEEELRRIKSMIMRGRILRPFAGTSSRIVRYLAAPYLYSETEEVMALGRVIGRRRNFFDGNRFGLEVGASGLIADPAAAPLFRRQHNFYSLLDWQQEFPETTLIGRTSLGSSDALALRLGGPPGSSDLTRFYVHAETFLPLRRDRLELTGTGTRVVARTIYDDWRIVSGLTVRMPFKLIISTGPVTETIEFDSIELDAAIDPAEFHPRVVVPD